MPRIPKLDIEALTERQKALAASIGSNRGGRLSTDGPWGVLLRNPDLCERALALGNLLRDGTSLDKRLSELAIACTARHWTAQYEWNAHAPQALKAGISPEVIEAIRHRRRPQFEKADEAAVYDFITGLLEGKTVSDETWQAAAACIGADALVELTAVSGFYSLVAMLIVGLEVPLREGIDPPLPE